LLNKAAVEVPVSQLVKALRCNPEGQGFDFQWYRGDFALT
jgi:hypothetical protein